MAKQAPFTYESLAKQAHFTFESLAKKAHFTCQSLAQQAHFRFESLAKQANFECEPLAKQAHLTLESLAKQAHFTLKSLAKQAHFKPWKGGVVLFKCLFRGLLSCSKALYGIIIRLKGFKTFNYLPLLAFPTMAKYSASVLNVCLMYFEGMLNLF